MSSPDHAHEGRIPGSFRDPSGYVFMRQGRLFRAIDETCHAALAELTSNGTLAELFRQSMLVRTETVADPELQAALAAEQPGFQHFLEHEVLSPITFPYEWTVSMLADAAALTIDLQLRLLAAGYGLKDASAFNVQFAAGRPQFIDLGSIERPSRRDVWFALGQFQRMFLFPLLLCRRGWDLRSYFRSNLDGRDLEQVAHAIGWPRLISPAMLLDVTLPLWLGRWAKRSNAALHTANETPRSQSETRPANHGSAAQMANLRRLRRKVLRLAASYRPRGAWADYAGHCHYNEAAAAAKRQFVAELLRQSAPRRVIDLGCNTGDYSRLAAEAGADVVAVDSDHDAVELLYRQLQKTPARIAPMVADITDPSPALGFMNRERPALLQRIRGDCVLALALLHHLLVAGNLSLPAACELVAALTERDLVLEFIPPDDPMFRRLLQFRVDYFAGLSLEAVRAAFAPCFEIISEKPLPPSGRVLLFLRRRG